MSRYVFKLPDLGEGTVSSEIVAWRVKVGDVVAEDDPLVELATDKAVVEVPAPVSGMIVYLLGQPGDVVAVGADLVVFDTSVRSAEAVVPVVSVAASANPAERMAPAEAPVVSPAQVARVAQVAPRSGRVMASPATRRRAREAGIDLAAVAGSGPNGRILAADLAVGRTTGSLECAAPLVRRPREGTEELRIIGVRRVIAERTLATTRNIPHFSYVEEVDVTDLERLRSELNSQLAPGQPPYSYLPFIVGALAAVLEHFPQCNAHYDEERKVLIRHRAVHVGVATQTPDGLKVPVVRHVEALELGPLAAAIRTAAQSARDGTARRADLSGSTITVTSLGKLGGIASTPVLNAPEVAIVGVNKALERPVVKSGSIMIRRVMNLSSSFDHRFVDGFDAAAMIQALKERLEEPATIFSMPQGGEDTRV